MRKKNKKNNDNGDKKEKQPYSWDNQESGRER